MDRNKNVQGGMGTPVRGLGGYMHNAGEQAAHDGRTIGGWANDITPGVAQNVLTTAGLIRNLVPGDTVFITQIMFAVETVSDSAHFELGYLDAGGTFYPLTPHWHQATGAAISGRTSETYVFHPAVPASYGAGVRSITFRVSANDAGAAITLGWWGYIERT